MDDFQFSFLNKNLTFATLCVFDRNDDIILTANIDFFSLMAVWFFDRFSHLEIIEFSQALRWNLDPKMA